MKRLLSTLLSVGLIITTLTACSSSVSTSQSGTAAAGNEEHVTLKIMAENSDQLVSDMFKARIAQFTEIHPNVTVELEELTFSDFPTKLNLAFTGGVAPDIICGAISNIANGVARGQYEPLGEYISNWSDKDDILDGLYEMGTYQGELYGIPYNLAPQLLVYRKDFFEEAGLDPEKAPSTWEKILDAAQKTMKEENGNIVRSGFSVSVDGTFNPIMFARTNGADLFDEDTGKYTVNTPEFIEAAEYVAELQKTSMAVNSQLENSQHPMTTGNAAMSLIPVGKLKTWLQDVPDMADKIGFIIPEHKQASAWSGANYMHLSAQSKHKELAWEFIEMCFSEENIRSNFTDYGLANVRKSLQDEYKEQNPVFADAMEAAIACGKGANKVTNFNLGSAKLLVPAMQEIYYGSKTAEQALNDAAAQYEQTVQTG